jgi:hypothetical protein
MAADDAVAVAWRRVELAHARLASIEMQLTEAYAELKDAKAVYAAARKTRRQDRKRAPHRNDEF